MIKGTIHCATCFEPAYSAYGHKRDCPHYGVHGYAAHYYRSTPTWWTCRCSACVLQRQEKDDQYRDNAINGQL